MHGTFARPAHCGPQYSAGFESIAFSFQLSAFGSTTMVLAVTLPSQSRTHHLRSTD
jgi:hypothetical protein